MSRAPSRILRILEAPSVLGLFPGGVEEAPAALLSAGLDQRLGASSVERVDPPAYLAERDPQTLLRNPQGIAAYARALADATGNVLDRGAFPLVLGGDCSILLGSLLALRRRGRYGLLFLDGHADFYEPEREPQGEVASMELALATGRGPALLSDLEGLRPLVRDEDVVILGRRDGPEAEAHRSQRVESTAIQVVDLPVLRRKGAEVVAASTVARLSHPSLSGFWIHFDVDVLEDRIMPAVDYRMPGGLSWIEAGLILGTALSTGRAVGMQVTIFNPRLDPTGALARGLVDALAAAFGRDELRS